MDFVTARRLVVLLTATAAVLSAAPVKSQSVHQHAIHELASREPGQAAFAAIQEIVSLLEADPTTDWKKVYIDALRQHLVDMDVVTMSAAVDTHSANGGLRFAVTGRGAAVGSIRRMIAAHAATMNGAGGWRYTSDTIEDGATLTVEVPPSEITKLKALGFFGVMANGMHHQEHHLMIARGGNAHRH